MAVDIGYILNQWDKFGVFNYVIPFLLIFAIVFGILTAINIFRGNRTVDVIIAASVALMALINGFVPAFFSGVFPRLGVGLAVVLVFIILAGFFIDPSRSWIMYILLGIGTIAALTVLIQTSGDLGWFSSYWVSDNLNFLIGALAVVIIIAIVAGSSSPRSPHAYELKEWRTGGGRSGGP